jgi:large repetitive protein
MKLKSMKASLLAVVLVAVFCVPGLSEESINCFYDDLGRLIRIQYSDGTQQYTYDEVGNRETRSVQEGTCVYSVWPPDQSFSQSGGTAAISVAVGPSCPWTVTSDESWITITSGANGTGSGTVTYTFTQTASPRQGSISVAGQSIIISQVQTPDVTPPAGSISIDSGAAYANSVNVTLRLTCTDNIKCLGMRFSNDNVTYSAPEVYGTSKAWVLTSGGGPKTVYARFVDAAGNWSTAYSDTIMMYSTCANPNVRIGATTYATLQTAYNAAVTGDVIQCQGFIIDNLTANRNITITIDGGYDCNFTATPGNTTFVKGMITAAQGSMTLRNLALYSGIGVPGGTCANPNVRIGATTYATLQTAYNAAVTGDVIQCQGTKFTDNLAANRNITVTIDGGYDCNFTVNTGNMSVVKGVINAIQGSTTLKNINLETQ